MKIIDFYQIEMIDYYQMERIYVIRWNIRFLSDEMLDFYSQSIDLIFYLA